MITRRGFLTTAATAGAGLVIGFYLPSVGQAEEPKNGFQPNAWLQVTPDDKVVIWVAKSEMGQGIRTALPMIVAEELEADWKNVSIEPALYDKKYGDQGTGGSSSVREGWEPLRKAGATGRAMLIAAAAKQWGVPAATCYARQGAVHHKVSGKKASYGSLANAAAKLPVPKAAPLKNAKDFRIVGKPTPRLDTPGKVRGKAQFGIDVQVPDMQYASVAQCPVFGGKVASFDAARAKSMPGVKAVVPVGSGVGVVADSYWNALSARRALDIKWDEGPNKDLNSAAIRQHFEELSKKPEGLKMQHEGDPDKAFAAAGKKLDAVYEVPLLAHACMEPMNCTADVRSDRAEVWSPTQFPSWLVDAAAGKVGLKPEQFKVNITLLGSGFGRRAMPDFSLQAIELSKAVSAPVKVIWTREDDVQHDFYRPSSYHHLRGALDAQGRLVAWTHRIVAPSIDEFNMGPLKNGRDDDIADGAPIPYSVPNIHVDYVIAPSVVPMGWWRSVFNTQNAYANESFMDELAAQAGKDPLDFRLKMLDKAPQHKRVLELAAGKFGWGKPLPEGHVAGLAVHKSFGTVVAEVAEVSVEKDGTPRVHRVVCAVDCGQTINPNTIEAQMQGAIVLGLGAALRGKITVENGRVQQGNFDDYPVLRLNEMPKVEVHIVPSTQPPQGIGEPGTPPITPAVVNALFAMNKKPIRVLPILG